MSDTISSLQAQVQQLQHDKAELENQRERLLAELDAANRKIKGLASAQTSAAGTGSDADSFSGLGLTFHRENPDWSPDGVVVKRVKPRGAAAASGLIQEGDTVLKIDGTTVSGVASEDLAQMCIGKRGTSATLLVRKRSTRQEISVELMRKERAAVAFLDKEEREFDLVSGQLSRETSRQSIWNTPPSPQAANRRPVPRRSNGWGGGGGRKASLHTEGSLDSISSMSSVMSGGRRGEVGLGLTFRRSSGQYVISRVKEGSAAALQGSISPGDTLVAIDNEELAGKPLQTVCRAMMAAPGVAAQVDIINRDGNRVSLTLVRPGQAQAGGGLKAEDSSLSIGSVYENDCGGAGGGVAGDRKGVG